MAKDLKTESLRPDYIRFGKNESHLAEIFDRRQGNQNFARNKKEEEIPKEEVKKTKFVDRSSQLSGSLNSLALFNMINLKRSEKTSKSKPDIFTDEKPTDKSEIINPFAKKD